jgi:hypothetical protein
VPTIDDTIEQLRQHCADALLRAEQAFAEAERLKAALRALVADAPLDAGTATRLAAAADLRPAARKRRPDPPQLSRPTEVRRAQRLREPISYGEVALIANSARERGESMRDAVAKHFAINKPAADMRISTARKNGFDIPRGPVGKASAPAPASPRRPEFTPDDATRLLEEGDGVDD